VIDGVIILTESLSSYHQLSLSSDHLSLLVMMLGVRSYCYFLLLITITITFTVIVINNRSITNNIFHRTVFRNDSIPEIFKTWVVRDICCVSNHHWSWDFAWIFLKQWLGVRSFLNCYCSWRVNLKGWKTVSSIRNHQKSVEITGNH
jgi:hypothetical protein